MGVKDHLEDGTGHILSLGLDLDYLHVDGAERQVGLSSAVPGAGHTGAKAGAPSSTSDSLGSSSTSFSTNSSFSSSSSCSNFSDSDDERLHNGSGSDSQNPRRPPLQHQESPPALQAVVTLDLAPNRCPGENPPQPEASPPPADPLTDFRAKVEFALKLGYSEELVLLVLRKLGPDALINDVLGELVKLGTSRTELEQQGGGPAASQSPSSSSLSSSLASSFSSSSSSFSSSSSSSSSSSLDSCRLPEDKDNLRPVVLDGSNVAMSHGNKEVFSCHGIQLAVDWFLDRGHRDITVFVPAWRKEQSRPDALITDQEILRRLEKEKILVFTPSRRVQGRRVVCYDDRFIVKLAHESEGIIVSNDNYRDLANEKPEWKKFVDERLLMYSFVNDKFMPPDDPLGRHGPSLENFLRKRPIMAEHRKQPCPYGKKCTYGHKCKFFHPERGSRPQRAVADELRAKMSCVASRGQLEDAPTPTRPSPPDGTAEAERSRRSQPSPRCSLSDLLEDRLRTQSNADGGCRGTDGGCRGTDDGGCRGTDGGCRGTDGGCRGTDGGGCRGTDGGGCRGTDGDGCRGTDGGCRGTDGGGCRGTDGGRGGFLGYPLPGSFNRWEYPGGNGGGGSGSGPSRLEAYRRCGSPEPGYRSLVKAYSGLGLAAAPPGPDCFLPAGSLPSDCSGDDSFSPDPSLLDDGPECHHYRHHHHPRRHHHHHHFPGQCARPVSRVPPGLGHHAPRGCPVPPAPVPAHGPPRPFESPSAFVPPHLQRPLLSGFPGEFPARASGARSSHSQSSPLGRDPLGSPWREGGLRDSQVCKGSPLHSRTNHPGLNQRAQQHAVNWDARYQQAPEPRYDPYAFQSLPEVPEEAWLSPWGRQTHSSPRGLSASSLPPLAQLSPAPIKTHPAPAPGRQEPPALGRYQDLRERVFVNLCRIFPADLVRTAMIGNPRLADAQELAAVILMEKSQRGS